VVIIADASLIVEALWLGLRKCGEFNVVGHADGRTTSASTIIAASPDVVILDEMDHSAAVTELIRDIRAEDQRVAMIVLSLEMDPDWLGEIFSAGATAAISKATHPVAVSTLLRETLSGHIVHRFAAPGVAKADVASSAGAELPLTARELEILQLVASGATNGEVARLLWVTEQTVKFHLRNIYRKLDVANRTQASHVAHVSGLVNAGSELASQPELTVAS
jgi:DNA-binding NarL/FixJ family response regulator